MRPMNSTLRKVLVLAALALVLAVMLVGCVTPIQRPIETPAQQAVATTVAEEPDEEPAEEPAAESAQAPSYVVTDDAAPCTSLVDLNLAHTSEALDTETFWTWHINFQPADGRISGADFYGCLQFYVRESGTASQVFEPTSLYVLTPCYFVNPAGGAFPTLTPEMIWTSDGSKEISAMRATFDGGGFLACPINLIEAGFAVVSDPNFAGDLGNIASNRGWNEVELTDRVVEELPDPANATPVQLYEMLSIVAASQPLIEEQDIAAQAWGQPPVPTHPLLYYAPDCTDYPGECPNPLSHALFPLPNGTPDNFSLGSEMQQSLYHFVDPAICEEEPDACQFPFDPFPAWYSTVVFGETARPYVAPSISQPCIAEALSSGLESYLMLGAVPVTDTSSVNNWAIRCTSQIDPSLDGSDGTADLQAGIPFWVGDATILVGFDPRYGSLFKGDIYEVWIDPENSGTKLRIPEE